MQRDIGFTAILLLVANWGDVTLPAGLCMGLPAVGVRAAIWHFSGTSCHPFDKRGGTPGLAEPQQHHFGSAQARCR